MCGIIFTNRKDGKACKKTLLKRFDAQKSRGTQGFGVIEFTGDAIEHWYRAQYEDGIKKQMKDSNSTGSLFHHRFPTSTINVDEATHPIKVSHEKLAFDYYVVHNGVISNAGSLKEKYEKQGYVYNTIVQTQYVAGNTIYTGEVKFNDSESFAIDIAKAIEDHKIIDLDSTGSIAFVVLQVEKNTSKISAVFYGRNYQNPLKIEDNDNMFVLSSEGNGADVPAHELWKYDIATHETSLVRKLWIGSYRVEPTTPSTCGYKTPTTSQYNYDEDDDMDRYGAWYRGEKTRIEKDTAEKAEIADRSDEEFDFYVRVKDGWGNYNVFFDYDSFLDYGNEILDLIDDAEGELKKARAEGNATQIENYEDMITDLEITKAYYDEEIERIEMELSEKADDTIVTEDATLIDEKKPDQLSLDLEKALKDF